MRSTLARAPSSSRAEDDCNEHGTPLAEDIADRRRSKWRSTPAAIRLLVVASNRAESPGCQPGERGTRVVRGESRGDPSEALFGSASPSANPAGAGKRSVSPSRRGSALPKPHNVVPRPPSNAERTRRGTLRTAVGRNTPGVERLPGVEIRGSAPCWVAMLAAASLRCRRRARASERVRRNRRPAAGAQDGDSGGRFGRCSAG